MRTFNTTILIVALTFPCAGLPGEGHNSHSVINSALSAPELRFVLVTIHLVIAILEREINAVHNNPTTKNNLRKKQAMYRADAIKVAEELWQRIS